MQFQDTKPGQNNVRVVPAEAMDYSDTSRSVRKRLWVSVKGQGRRSFSSHITDHNCII